MRLRNVEAGGFARRDKIMDAIMTWPFVLGHPETELRRLAMQSAFWGKLTEEVFQRASIGVGIRVLDIGSGAGDIAFLAAGLVGSSGSVLGIDRSEDAVKRASAWAAEHGLDWCHFPLRMWMPLRRTSVLTRVVGRLALTRPELRSLVPPS